MGMGRAKKGARGIGGICEKDKKRRRRRAGNGREGETSDLVLQKGG